MPDYIVSGRNEDGKTVTRIIKTATAQDALDIMRERGCTDLILRTDDIAAALFRHFPANRKVSPGRFIKLIRLTAVGRLRWALKLLGLIWAAFSAVLLVVYFVTNLDPRSDMSWMHCAVVSGLIFLILVPPMLISWYRNAWRYDRLMNATALGRWDDALRLASSRGSLPAKEIAFRRAVALAGSGRLDEALDVYDREAADPKDPEWLDRMKLCDIFAFGGDEAQSVAYLEEAVQLSPLNPSVMLMLAAKRLRRGHDTAEARELLGCAIENPIAETIRYLVSYVEGLIALHENDAARARDRLTRALQELEPFRTNPLIMLADAAIRGALATAHARLGDRDAAEREFRVAERYLRAHHFFRSTIREYQEAIAVT